jgi:hypothetical protein
MKEKELKDILRRDFNFDENWKPLFSMLFNKVQYFSNPSNPFSESAKVVSGKQTGVVKLDDGKQLAIFEVEVDDSIRIDKNRQGLREIAIKHIDQNITHGAFVFFYSKYQKDFRFSFIARWSELDLETGEFKKGETKPKRYTYLLGDNEACTTAAKRLLMLAAKRDNQEISIKDIIDTFSVESLNKEFFKTYKEHYERFWRFIANSENGYREILLDKTKEKPEQQEKPIRDFAKKLLGRIVFLHFLQKKGWMGCDAKNTKWENGEKQFMQMLFSDFSDKAHFHSKCLTKLFFNTLNTRRSNDIFEIAGLTGKLNGSRVPYLNGGLFDTDKPEAVLSIDFPEKYFAELLDFFEQYNFTIDENSPDDHEVGIDPEMLGHIFENLLEENREKGAFYTPKEVVQYMCKESLIQYLNNSFDESVNVSLFIRNHIVSEKLAVKDNAVLLNELLDNIKVCDPAIGSGAFPIGILQEIFEAKKFIYPYLKTNKEFNPAQVKKDIIQKSIYGVDLEKGAVDIAQLRFWLALVVDEENPHPLPNLDYKIMQGNSLLESFEGIDLSKVANSDIKIIEPERDLFGNIVQSQLKMTFTQSGLVKELKELIKKHFNIENAIEKKDIRQRIDELVNQHIAYNLELRESQLKRLISEAGNPELLSKTGQKKHQAYLDELKDFERKREELLKIQNSNERPYFLWHLFFLDVFEKGGFDVIIGNPPYIQLQKMGKDADILQGSGFETFERTGDIYCLFYEKGFDLLKNDRGILSYITSNSWMKTKYGEALRKYFINYTNPIELLNFEDTLIFPSATVEVNILISKKAKNKGVLEVVVFDKTFNTSVSIYDFYQKNSYTITHFDDNGWVISDKESMNLKSEIEKNTKPLSEFNIQMFIGLLIGLNEAFIVDAETKDEFIKIDPKNRDILKPLLRGRDVQKFAYNFENNWLIFAHNGVKKLNIERINVIDDYPIIFNHLKNYEEKLIIRHNQGDHWTNMRNCAYLKEFEKPKIIWGEISDKPKFCFDDKGIYMNDRCSFMVGENLKFILVLLNSKLIEWYFNLISTSSGMGTNMWKHYKIKLLPIPKNINYDTFYKIEIISEYLIILNDRNTSQILEHSTNEIISHNIEEISNMIVFELYFEEHMKEKEIDVLQFVDFPDISKMQSFEEKRDTIQKIYYWLKEKDNPIRNRILVSESRSWIIKRINQSTH